jgi:hypothetical protein
MRVLFFVEGESEVRLVRYMMKQCCSGAKEVKSLFDLDSNVNLAGVSYHCFDCNSVDKIQHSIARHVSVLYKTNAIPFVVCDTEIKTCYQSRKESVLSKLLENTEIAVRVNCVFFKPQIEVLYWQFPDLILEVINKLRQRLGVEASTESLPKVSGQYKHNLNTVCKQHNVRYVTGEFAEYFFGLLKKDQFESSPELRRFAELLENVLGNE